MTREEMVEEAEALGVKFRSTLSDEKLAERIALVKAALEGDEMLDLPDEDVEVLPDPVPSDDPATAHEPERAHEAPKVEESDTRARRRGRVLWPNVHSSEGKHFKGEEHDFLEDDFKLLDDLDAIKGVG